MAKGKQIKGEWADLAVPGARLAVRATPNARANLASRDGTALRISVTDPPDEGRANEAVTALLAHALGIAPSRLTLISGAAARDKAFRLD
jgi:uncharacterized protein YggU (UPF0235/DUF167 family)